jgi:hypothetical protein
MLMLFDEVPMNVREALAEQSIKTNAIGREEESITYQFLTPNFVNIEVEDIVHLQVPNSEVALGNAEQFIPGYVIFFEELNNENDLWWGYLLNYQIPNKPNHRLVQKIIKF